MGIFDFFKRKTPEKKRLVYEDLDKWIIERNNELFKNKQFILDKIKEKVSILITNLKENIIKLEQISLDNKKAEDKIKLIVKENLEKYIVNLNYIIKLLEKLEYNSYDQVIIKIDSILNDFKKRSLMHYEKATILIGEELGITKENLSQLTRDLNNIVKENEQSIKDNKNIRDINEELDAMKSTNELIEECNKKILVITETIKLKEREIEDYEKEIINLKDSKEYKKELTEKTSFFQLKIDHENKINDLKNSIDFKKISSFHHVDPKKMKIITELKEDFKENYLKNKEKLISMLKESSIYSKEAEKLIEEESLSDSIAKEKENSMNNQISIEIESLENKINKIKEEIIYLKEDKDKQEKLKIKFIESKSLFLDKIKAILMSMNIEVS